MSGPKVVRVVTREELEAIGRRQIAAVDAAIACRLICPSHHETIRPDRAHKLHPTACSRQLMRSLRRMRKAAQESGHDQTRPACGICMAPQKPGGFTPPRP